MHSFISTTIQESSSKVVDLMHKVFYTSCRQQLARKPSCAWLATSVGREKADVAPRKAVGIRTTDGPSLRDFMRQQQPSLQTSPVGASSEENRAATAVPYLSESDLHGRGRRGEDTQHGGAWWAVRQLTRLLVSCLGSHAWPPEVGLEFCCHFPSIL